MMLVIVCISPCPAGSRGRRIWIVGDSLVRRAGERAKSTGHQHLEAQPDNQVRWFGRGGLQLHDLPRTIQNLLRHHATPDVVVLHAGSNDIGRYAVKLCRQAVEEVLLSTRQLLPECHICFSEIVPRLFYYGRADGPHSQSALNKCRKTVNKYARGKIRRMFRASFLKHDINTQDHELFHRDGVHLSESGNDLLINDFKMTLHMLSI